MSRLSPQSDIVIRFRQDSVKPYMAPAAQHAAPHFHYQHELLLPVEGSAEFEISGRRYQAAPGCLLFMSNLENHSVVSSSTGFARYIMRFSNEALAVYLRDPLLLSVFKQRPEGFCHRYLCRERELAAYLRLARQMEREYRRQAPCWDQMVVSGLLAILVGIYRTDPAFFPGHRGAEGQNLIFDVQNYIEGNLQGDLSLDAVSARFFVNRYHLSHLFPQVTGYTFKSYILMARISKAKDLLLSTDREVRSVSEAVGFHSVSHFIRTFRKMEELSPLQYRGRARRRDSVPEAVT